MGLERSQSSKRAAMHLVSTHNILEMFLKISYTVFACTAMLSIPFSKDA